MDKELKKIISSGINSQSYHFLLKVCSNHICIF